IRNAAHDSVCACSRDEVVDAVLHRYGEATDIGEGLVERAVAGLASRAGGDGGGGGAGAGGAGAVVVNPVARTRGGLVELRLPGAEAPAGTQLVRRHGGDVGLVEGPAALVTPAAEEGDWSAGHEAFRLETADGRELVANERVDGGQLVTPAVRAALAAVDEPGPVRLRVRRREAVTVLARVEDVPGFGWARWTPDAGAAGAGGAAGADRTAPVTVDGLRLTNGLVAVEVDPEDGTFSLDGHAGLGRLVD